MSKTRLTEADRPLRWVLVGVIGEMVIPVRDRAQDVAGLRLGETVLRTSSAGPAALAVLNVVLRRW